MGEGRHVDRRRVPARCDGCGRTAADAGMAQHGWAVSPVTAAVPGTYCLQCASALRMLDWFVRCTECGAVVESEAAAEATGWRFFSDQLGQLQPCCAFCSVERREL